MTDKKKGRGFGSIAKKSLVKDQAKPGSMKDFLKDDNDESTESSAVQDTDRETPSQDLPTPESSIKKPKRKRTNLLDRRTVYLSQEGSDALDDLHLTLKKIVGPGMKQKVNVSIVVDMAIQFCFSEFEQNHDESDFVKSVVSLFQ